MGLFKKDEDKKGMRLTSITELNVNTKNNILYKNIQNKIGCNDNLMERIKKAMPEHTRCKTETWEHDDGEWYQRAKTWITIDGKTEYDEIEDVGYEVTVLPTHIWETILCNLLTDEESEAEEKRGDSNIGSIRINFVYNSQFGQPPYYLLYMSGSKFEKKPEKENTFADMRILEDKLLEDAVIFKLAPYDFELLKPYHCDVNNSFVFPDDPMYYVPMDDYRKYSNWMLCGKEKREEVKKIGIHWVLELRDFTSSFLPKLEKDK